MSEIDALARMHFLWGYTPRKGDVVMDVGAGVGEEALLFSREVGERGKVICVEAHPTTYGCLEKLVKYNHLDNVTAIHQAVTEPSCHVATIEDSGDYLCNRVLKSTGIPVVGTTLDAIHEKLGLGRINFMKMNIEGAERLAIKGMTGILKHTEILCISCHDFLAEGTGDEFFRTKSLVKEFLEQNGLNLAARLEQSLPPYLKDQVWARNELLMKGATI
jgi:FkbM family methyltransferase